MARFIASIPAICGVDDHSYFSALFSMKQAATGRPTTTKYCKNIHPNHQADPLYDFKSPPKRS